MAMYKNSIMSLFYLYLSMLLFCNKFNMSNNLKIILFVSLLLIAQYIIALTNITNNYPIPFNPDHTPYKEPPYFNWKKYVGWEMDVKKYFIIDGSSSTFYSIKHELVFILIGSFYMFLFSPYIFNSSEEEFNKAIGLPDDPSLRFLV